MLDGEIPARVKSIDAPQKHTHTHLDTCSDLLSLLLFFCLAFHVQSLVCDSCISAEDRGREHNLCDGGEVKKEKKRWQNE